MNSRLRIVALSLAIGYTVCQLFAAAPTASAATFSAANISAAVNSARATNGLNELDVNSALTAAAESRANDMVTRNYFAHESPDGQLPWDVALENGYDYRVIGENLATNWLSVQATVNAWMASPAHRENILNPTYVDTGVGVASVNGKIIVVQLFGAPVAESSLRAPVQKKNVPPASPAASEPPTDVLPNIPAAVPPEAAVPTATLYRADSPALSALDSQPFLLDRPSQLNFTEALDSTVLGATYELPAGESPAAAGEGAATSLMTVLCGSLIFIGASFSRRMV